MLTESEAWRMIGEAFEARAAHPELVAPDETDLAAYGICRALALLQRERGEMSWATYESMRDKTHAAVRDSGGCVILRPDWSDAEGAPVRAMLAYLFAEEAAA